ncbi:PREDICTED: non-structural maintenance of chromosomes element 4 homolog A-like [Calidris pugnax]|uniref:non-structural maintenance of chromosomes element 4 homolog A-like n=1 Tax=Calidris pugnax TaxID=198806 RepID=UPI00071C59A9|nr:PREDICTED: non-structural maintenance of chromosomes element 4 homolog A-like [Calidris pugnax]
MSEASGSDDFSSSSSSSQSSSAERGRPSTSRNGAVPQHKQHRLSGRPLAPEEEGEEPEAAGDKPRRLESAEVAGDERSRRMLRNQYRELICSVQQNREDMLSSKSNRLTEALEEANKLFSGVSCAREAALDAQFLVLASNLGKEKANELHSEMTAFDSLAFADDLPEHPSVSQSQFSVLKMEKCMDVDVDADADVDGDVDVDEDGRDFKFLSEDKPVFLKTVT